MKYFLLILTVSFLFETAFAQKFQLKNSLIIKTDDSIMETHSSREKITNIKKRINWMLNTNRLKALNTTQKLDSIFTQLSKYPTSYEPYMLETFSYNNDGLNTDYYCYYYENGVLLDLVIQESYTYNTNRLSEINSYVIDLTNNSKQIALKNELKYNSSNKLSSVSYLSWDDENQLFNTEMRVDLIYNSNNLIDSLRYYQINGTNESLTGALKEIYNEEFQVIKEKGYLDQAASGFLSLATITEYSYQNKNLDTIIEMYVAENGKIMPQERESYLYGENGLIKTDQLEIYNEDTQKWEPIDKTEFTHRDDLIAESVIFPINLEGPLPFVTYESGIIDETKAYNYDGNWEQYMTRKYYYSSLSNGIKNPIQSGDWAVYPNPANDYIRLISSNNLKTTCILFDVCGRNIKQQDIYPGQTIDLSELKAGYYVLHLIDDQNHIAVLKIQKQ